MFLPIVTAVDLNMSRVEADGSMDHVIMRAELHGRHPNGEEDGKKDRSTGYERAFFIPPEISPSHPEKEHGGRAKYVDRR